MDRTASGKRVTAIESIKYGGSFGTVPKGSQGTIRDFGSVSGDPIVEWDNKFYRQTIVPWGLLIEEGDRAQSN